MYLEEIDYIKGKIKVADNLLDSIKASDCESIKVGEQISDTINALSASLLKAKELPREFGISFDYEGVEMPMEVVETHKGEKIGYLFVLPCLLDKREDNSSYSKTREHAKKCFGEAFKRYSDDKGFKHISDKVRITYTNHFKDTRSMIDCDNIDTKAFTDMITMYILDDDNPDKVELCIKGLADGHSRTEVYVETL